MIEIIPQLSDKLRADLKKLGYNSEPEIISVEPRPNASIQECWANVPAAIAAEGGSQITGRIVWKQEHGKWLQLEAHAIWQKADGTIVDPTPKLSDEKTILFVREHLEWRGYPISPIWRNYSPDTKRVVQLMELVEKRKSEIPFGQQIEATADEIAIREELNALLHKLFASSEQKLMQQWGKHLK